MNALVRRSPEIQHVSAAYVPSTLPPTFLLRNLYPYTRFLPHPDGSSDALGTWITLSGVITPCRQRIGYTQIIMCNFFHEVQYAIAPLVLCSQLSWCWHSLLVRQK